ncbi:GNAT family N-acetyltransferase [Halobellus ordinarius]|uniref:GNAT family N-acetyltransferase n=1 Tax=Halobellus ordinarius TaxID=3075120 RepID=UPI002880B8A7|nr:N-acetyltransferase [Halobellus sp. ZY16]
MIRPVRRDDLPTLATLQSYLSSPSPDLLDAVPAVGTCLVAVDDREAERPIGYLLAVDGEDTHLAELVVHPEHRREGHGRELLSAFLAEQDSGTRVTLAVAVDNEPARSLYESVGFEPIGYNEGFYESDGEGDGEEGADDRKESADSDRSSDAVIYAYDV